MVTFQQYSLLSNADDYIKALTMVNSNAQYLLAQSNQQSYGIRSNVFFDKIIMDMHENSALLTLIREKKLQSILTLTLTLTLTQKRLMERLRDQKHHQQHTETVIDLSNSPPWQEMIMGVPLYKVFNRNKAALDKSEYWQAYEIACAKTLSGHSYLNDYGYKPVAVKIDREECVFSLVEIRENRHANNRFFALKQRDTGQFMIFCETKAAHNMFEYETLALNKLKSITFS